MEQRAAGGGVSIPGSAADMDRARVRFLLPGVRRGFLISVVPIAILGALLAASDADGTVIWLAVRVVVSVVLFAATARLGDGLADPGRTLRHLTVIMFVGSVGWGLLPVLVRSNDVEVHAVLAFGVIANVAIVTSTCAADRRVYLAAAAPVSVLGLVGLLIVNHDITAILVVLVVLALPYSYAIFVSTNRTLTDGFGHELRNQALVVELEQRQIELGAANEQLRLAAADQAVLLAERAALIAAVGHDLGSPLGAAMLTAELLADRHESLPSDQHTVLARRIHGQVHDAVTVLRDLTSSQRLSEDDIDARRTHVDLHDIVEIVLARAAHAAQEIGSGIPEDAWVWADPALLERILDNLVANAIKYTPDTCHIEIGWSAPGDAVATETARATETGRATAGETLLWVDDDGPGLAAEMADSVFEPYVRGTSLAATSGSGVGLFLVRTFVTLHGGRVWWQPSERGGSRFVVALPARSALDTPAPSHTEASHTVPEGVGIPVLHADRS